MAFGDNMTTCEVCGTNKGPYYIVMVEGSRVSCCKECSKYGHILIAPVEPKSKKSDSAEGEKPSRPVIEEMVMSDYWIKIRTAFEKSGMEQDDFAKRINVKVSVLQNMISNKFVPDLKLAKRLEKELSIRLIEEQADVRGAYNEDKSKMPTTLGDIITIKKKK